MIRPTGCCTRLPCPHCRVAGALAQPRMQSLRVLRVLRSCSLPESACAGLDSASTRLSGLVYLSACHGRNACCL